MTELSPAARRILAQARNAQPRASEALRARVKARVAASVEPAAHSGDPGSSQPRLHTASRPWLVPLACTAAVLSGLSLLVWPERTPPSAATDKIAAPSSPAIIEEAHTEAQPHSDPPQLAAPEVTQTRPVATAVKPKSARSAAAPGGELRAEMNILSRAEAALRRDDPDTALRELASHAQRFRSGQLQAERTGLRLIARCMQGRESKAALARYLEDSDDAVLRARVREACTRMQP